MRTRNLWLDAAEEAGIPIEHRGLYVSARYPESEAVLRAFLYTEMGEDCRLLRPCDAPFLASGQRAVLHSPHDIRVESRTAIPKLSAWLGEQGVALHYGVAVTGIETGRLYTSIGEFQADRIIVCPGDDLSGLFAGRIRAHNISRCQLQMLRLADPGFRLPGAVMSDLSLIRYLGYADLPEAIALKARLEIEHPEPLANGVHLIVVQSADGSLVVGDSHHYDDAPAPFTSQAVDQLILDEYLFLEHVACKSVIAIVLETIADLMCTPSHLRGGVCIAGVGAFAQQIANTKQDAAIIVARDNQALAYMYNRVSFALQCGQGF